MAKTVTVTLRIRTQGDGLDHSDVFTFTNTNVCPAFYTNAAQGFNSYPLGDFAGAHAFVMAPPKSTSGNPTQSGVGKTLVGDLSDVGVPLDPACAQLLPVASLNLMYDAAEPVWFILA